MRLTAVHIDGFGIFCDEALPDLAEGLTLFHGANEAGKSTLLGFLRAIPYGFEGDKGEPARGAPLRGGRHGGWIEFVSRAGQAYHLERTPSSRRKSGQERLTNLESGESVSSDALDQLLGRTRWTTFKNIYAFRLAELQDWENLTPARAGVHIWTAGLGLTSVSLVDLEADLKARTEDLYTPDVRARKAINQTLRALRETRPALAAAQSDLQRYESEKGDLATLEAGAERLAEEAAALQQSQRRLEQYGEAWDDWVDLCAAREEVAHLPSEGGFPADGVRRLDELLTRRAAVDAEVSEVGDLISAAERKAEDLPIDPALIAARERIEALARSEQDLRNKLRDLPYRASEVQAAEEHLVRQLRDLGPDWDEQRLRTFDVSAPVLDQANQLSDRLGKAEGDVAAREQDLQRAAESEETARRVLEQAQAALAGFSEPAAADAEALQQRAAALAAARQALADLARADSEAAHRQDRASDLARQRAAADRRAQERAPSVPWWAIPLLLVVVGGIGAALRKPDVFVTAVLAGAILAAGLLWLKRRLDRAGATMQQRAEAELADIAAAQAENGGQAARARGQQSEAQTRLKECGAHLGLEVVGPGDVELAERKLAEIQDLLRQRHDAEAAGEKAREVAARAEEAGRRCRQAQEEARAALAAAQERWCAWLVERGLPPGMTPRGWQDLVSNIRRLREGLPNLDQTRARVAGIRRDIEAIRAEAEQTYRECGRPMPAADELPNGIVSLVAELQTSRDNAFKAEEAGRSIAGLHDKLGRLQSDRAEVESDLQGLITQAGAVDEEDFRQRGRRQERRQTLDQMVADAERALRRIAGVGERQEAFEAELAQVKPEETQPRLEAAKDAVKEVRARRDEVMRQRGALQNELRRLETSEEITRATQDQARLEEQLREQAEKYATLRAALYLLKKAQSKYERERQPEVIAQASEYVAKITDGVYGRVYVPLGGGTVKLVASDGAIREVGELSTGTQQQLYLAMRLAYVTVQNRAPGAEPLPLIMDEVLVNFDPERAQRTAELILDVARENQVLVFTCHPETVVLFRNLKPDVPVVAVTDGRLVPA